MKSNKKIYISCVILLIVFSLLNIYYLDTRIRNIEANERLLNKLILDAYSKIKQAGGVRSIDYPGGYDTLDKIPQRDLSTAEHTRLLSEAIKDLTGTLNLAGSKKETYYYLARAYMGVDDLENAEKYLNLDIEKGSQRELSYNNLWGLLVDKKRFDDAVVVADKYLKKYPDHLDAYYTFRGLIESKREDYKEALHFGELLVKINKSKYPLEAYANHQFLADLYEKMGDNENSRHEIQLAEKAREDYIALIKSKK